MLVLVSLFNFYHNNNYKYYKAYKKRNEIVWWVINICVLINLNKILGNF